MGLQAQREPIPPVRHIVLVGVKPLGPTSSRECVMNTTIGRSPTENTVGAMPINDLRSGWLFEFKDLLHLTIVP